MICATLAHLESVFDKARMQRMIETAKNEQAHAARTALLKARLRIMHEDIFPAHMPYQEAA